MKKRRYILAKWKDCERKEHSGVYFSSSKQELKKTFEKWKREGDILNYSIQERHSITGEY